LIFFAQSIHQATEGTANIKAGKDNPFFSRPPFDLILIFAIMKTNQKGGMPIEDDSQQLRRFSTHPVLSDTGNSRDRVDSETKSQ